MKPLLRVCPSCGDTIRRHSPCPSCGPTTRPPSPARIRRQRIYKTAHWQYVRQSVLNRDDHTCTTCGATDLEQQLVVDHIGGINYTDPYNPDLLRTLCLTCSGRADGTRGGHPHAA